MTNSTKFNPKPTIEVAPGESAGSLITNQIQNKTVENSNIIACISGNAPSTGECTINKTGGKRKNKRKNKRKINRASIIRSKKNKKRKSRKLKKVKNLTTKK